ncbi:MAG: nucleotidyltransferase family protein [Gammaproteobacteria bacterium]
MRAMIMAAGRGQRLRPITDTLPKPLVMVNEKPLIVHHLEALQSIGITDIVINLGYLGDKIRSALGKGQAFGVNIAYSIETTLLEVGGGVAHALPLLGEEPFLLINGDIWTDYPLRNLLNYPVKLAHIVLVPNPDHNLKGDYGLIEDNVINREASLTTYTYTGIGVFRPNLFKGIEGIYPLTTLLEKAQAQAGLTGELFRGRWSDVGTIARLQTLRNCLADCTPFKSN